MWFMARVALSIVCRSLGKKIAVMAPTQYGIAQCSAIKARAKSGSFAVVYLPKRTKISHPILFGATRSLYDGYDAYSQNPKDIILMIVHTAFVRIMFILLIYGSSRRSSA